MPTSEITAIFEHIGLNRGTNFPWFICTLHARRQFEHCLDPAGRIAFNSALGHQPPADFLGDEVRYSLAVLPVNAIARSFEQHRHIVPQNRRLTVVIASSYQEPRGLLASVIEWRLSRLPRNPTSPLAWFAIDAHALDQDGFQARVLVVVLAQVKTQRLRTVLLPSNEHAVVYQMGRWRTI